MDWDQVKGKWHEIKGSVRAKWGELSDSEVEEINGNAEKMIGRIQQRYGLAKEEAERQVKDWLDTHR